MHLPTKLGAHVWPDNKACEEIIAEHHKQVHSREAEASTNFINETNRDIELLAKINLERVPHVPQYPQSNLESAYFYAEKAIEPWRDTSDARIDEKQEKQLTISKYSDYSDLASTSFTSSFFPPYHSAYPAWPQKKGGHPCDLSFSSADSATGRIELAAGLCSKNGGIVKGKLRLNTAAAGVSIFAILSPVKSPGILTVQSRAVINAHFFAWAGAGVCPSAINVDLVLTISDSSGQVYSTRKGIYNYAGGFLNLNDKFNAVPFVLSNSVYIMNPEYVAASLSVELKLSSEKQDSTGVSRWLLIDMEGLSQPPGLLTLSNNGNAFVSGFSLQFSPD